MKIYINAAHKPSSPGAVYGGRSEHEDVLSFCRVLSERLVNAGFSQEIFIGYEKPEIKEDALVLIFHRGTSYKNAVSDGASVTVINDISADIQYEAYRMLEALTFAGGFRYRGVHTLTSFCPHRFIERTGAKRTFLFDMGFIESERDNFLFDCNKENIADALVKKLTEIYVKEGKNEDNS